MTVAPALESYRSVDEPHSGPTTVPTGLETPIYPDYQKLESAVCLIQRTYRFYRLRKLIDALQLSDPWLFEWKRNLPEGLSAEALKRRFSQRDFFDQIALFFRLVWFRPSHRYYAKLFLIAFMINHHEAAASILTKRIRTLGHAFVKVCEKPTCMFNRIRFIDAFSGYYRGFCDSKSKDTAVMAQPVLDEMGKSVDDWVTQMAQLCPTDSRFFETRDGLADKIRSTADIYCLMLSGMLGTSKQARLLVRFELEKRYFLAKVASTVQFQFSQHCATAKDRSFRSTALELQLHPNLHGVRVNSREEKYDSQKSSSLSVMRSPFHIKHSYVKQLIRCNFQLVCTSPGCTHSDKAVCLEPDCDSAQACWLPSFITHVSEVLKVMAQDVDIDVQCVAQQCARNCYDTDRMLGYMLSLMDNTAMAPVAVAEIREELTTQGASQAVLFRMLDTLDAMRVEFEDACHEYARSKIIGCSQANELRWFMEDLNFNTCGVRCMMKWVSTARDMTVATAGGRMGKLIVHFSHSMAAFPAPANLDAFPETFRLLRLSILRTQILIRDTVLAFTLLHFVINLSGDGGDVGRLKKHILRCLRSELNMPHSEMVIRLYDSITLERPCMSAKELKLVRAIVNKVARRPDIFTEKVPSLALSRIQQAIEGRLSIEGPSFDLDSPRFRLEHFQTELLEIVESSRAIWQLSVETYRPLYDVLTSSDGLWSGPESDSLPGTFLTFFNEEMSN